MTTRSLIISLTFVFFVQFADSLAVQDSCTSWYRFKNNAFASTNRIAYAISTANRHLVQGTEVVAVVLKRAHKIDTFGITSLDIENLTGKKIKNLSAIRASIFNGAENFEGMIVQCDFEFRNFVGFWISYTRLFPLKSPSPSDKKNYRGNYGSALHDSSDSASLFSDYLSKPIEDPIDKAGFCVDQTNSLSSNLTTRIDGDVSQTSKWYNSNPFSNTSPKLPFPEIVEDTPEDADEFPGPLTEKTVDANNNYPDELPEPLIAQTP